MLFLSRCTVSRVHHLSVACKHADVGKLEHRLYINMESPSPESEANAEVPEACILLNDQQRVTLWLQKLDLERL